MRAQNEIIFKGHHILHKPHEKPLENINYKKENTYYTKENTWQLKHNNSITNIKTPIQGAILKWHYAQIHTLDLSVHQCKLMYTEVNIVKLKKHSIPVHINTTDTNEKISQPVETEDKQIKEDFDEKLRKNSSGIHHQLTHQTKKPRWK